ncbi:MAG: patatin-like phospholipase family protein [Fusobacteriaceae bacterium]
MHFKYKFLKLRFFFMFFILTVLIMGEGSLSFPEDLEIKNIQNQIKELQLRVYELQLKKKEKFLNTLSKKKVGVVLSGGGAKGFAHIGVLRELEKNGIKIDYIAGTSMGAIIATLYSVGYSPDEIEKLVYTLDIEGIINAKQDRNELPLEQKLGISSQLFSVKYDNKLNFSLPKGLNNSTITYLKLKNLLWRVEGIKDFDKLPIPLRIIATDLDTGNGIAFREGDLALALTASVAIPTLMTPARIGEKQYVDGMIARNFPVQDMVDMGADIIIGSDVGIELSKNKEHNIVSIFNQLLAFYSANSTPDQKKMATFIITPNVSDFSPVDFTEVEKLVTAGEVATDKIIPDILAITPKNSNFTGRDSTVFFSEKKEKKFFFKKIIFKNPEFLSENNRELLLESFSEFRNSYLTKRELEETFRKLNSLDIVENIYYTLNFSTGEILLDIGVSPSNTLIIGGNYRSDYGTTFSLSTNILKSGKKGSLTNLGIKFGDYVGVELSNLYYYGITNKVGFFSSIAYDESPLLLYNKNEKRAKYIVENSNIKLGLSSQLKNRAFIAYGISGNATRMDLDTGSGLFEKFQYKKQFGDAFFNINYDTLDNHYFPHKGSKGNLSYTWGGTFLDDADEINYNALLYNFDQHYPLNEKSTVFFGLNGGFIDGESILLDRFIKVGGIRDNIKRSEFSFAGYHYQSKLTEHALIGKLGFQYELRPKFFLQGEYNIGTFKESHLESEEDKDRLWKSFVHGAQLGFSYDSPIGPLSVFLSTASQSAKDMLIQFNIGYYLD